MSMIIIIGFFVILAFVVGISFLFRGYIHLSAESVPVDELEEAKNNLKSANMQTEQARAQANTLAVQLDEMKGKLAWAQNNVKSLEDTLKKSSQAYARIEQLENDLNFLSQKADSQAREAIDLITRLAVETESLKAQISLPLKTIAVAVFPEDVTAIKDENQKLQIQIDGYANKVKDLEAAVVKAQEAGAKNTEVAGGNAQFAQENAVLKQSLRELEEKIKVAHTEAEQFKNQQAQIVKDLEIKVSQLETTAQAVLTPEPEKIVEKLAESVTPPIDMMAVEQELQRVRIQSEEQIVQANAALIKLNSDMETLTMQINDKDTRIKKLTEDLYSTREELSVSLRNVHELKQSLMIKVVPASDASDTGKEELQKRLLELTAANQRLINKEQILTYKLTQSRAQALSLERLCDELKAQDGILK